MRTLGFRHWWILPFTTLAGGVVGALLFGRRFRVPDEAPPSPDLVAATVVGFAIGGFVLGVILVLVLRQRDVDLHRVAEVKPNGVVVRAVRPTPGTRDAFYELTRDVGPGVSFGTMFPLSFDETGMTIWTREFMPRPGLTVPWTNISEVAIGDMHLPKGAFNREMPYQQLRVTILENGKLIELQCGVETGQSGWTAEHRMNQYHLANLIQRIEDVRDGIVRVRGDF